MYLMYVSVQKMCAQVSRIDTRYACKPPMQSVIGLCPVYVL